MEYKKILFSCGELSGETHTANLFRELKPIMGKNVRYYAVGSRILEQLGCRVLFDYHEISVMGFLEVIKKYFYIKKRINFIKKFIREQRPDLIVLIDFPGFNFIIARYARKFGIKIVYFIPPQIWAWHYKRIEEIKVLADLVIPVLPFEGEIYKKEKVKFYYAGHPLADNIKVTLNKNGFYKKFNILPNKKIIALLPGSRGQEVRNHINYLLGAAEKLEEKYNDLYFVINSADTINPALIKDYLKKYHIRNISIIEKQNYNLLNASFAGILVSGTVTLEAAFFKLPMAVIYKLDTLFFFIIKYFLVRIRFISLVNLIANKEIVKEILQHELTVENLVKEMDRLLTDSRYRVKMISSLGKVKSLLGKKGVIKKIARSIRLLV